MLYYTSEWVSIGHPDKVADYISEYILDRLIEKDPQTRYALEVQIKGVEVSLAGEITTKAKATEADFHKWAREAVNKIGYTKEYQKKFGKENTICGDDLIVRCNITKQSRDIAEGVDTNGWGDQGIFFGYYTEGGQRMDYRFASLLGQTLYYKALESEVLGIDIKTQVTMMNGKLYLVIAVPMVKGKEKQGIKEVKDLLEGTLPPESEYTINGTGHYCIHGPIADSGTTGRKLVVDFYGGASRIGGGSPWTKDGTKADLSLNLYARSKAKSVYKACKKIGAPVGWIETELSCCIGKNKVNMSITGFSPDGVPIHQESCVGIIKPSTCIKRFKLDKPVYAEMCMDGLFSKIK